MNRSKKDKSLVTPTGWTVTEIGRRSGTRHGRARLNRSLLWLLRLLIALAVLAGVAPYLHDDDLGSTLANVLKYRPAPPVNPGNQNGLLSN